MTGEPSASAAGDPTLKPIVILVGAACILVGVAWVLQAFAFTSKDAAEADVVWIILGAVVAGAGAGLVLLGRYWFPVSP